MSPEGDLPTSQMCIQKNFSNLPIETLIDLFEYIHADVFRGPTDIQWSYYDNQPEEKTGAQRWLVLLSVCRRWRALLLRARFWRIIHVYRRPNWLQHCLSIVRGSNVPLHIYFHRSALPRCHLSLLQPHLNTISVLAFEADPQWALPIRSLLSQAGGVGALSVQITGTQSEAPQANIGLSALTLPRLHSLTLREVVPPNDSTLYSRLRRLNLDSCTWTVNFGEFLSIMRGCVEDLTLHNVLSHATLDPASAQPHTPHQPVVLPHLRTLSMKHPPTLNARILAHFLLPAITEVYIAEDTTEIEEYGWGHEWGHEFHTFLTMLPPNPSAIIPPSLITRVVSLAFAADRMVFGVEEGMDYFVRGKDTSLREIICLGLATEHDRSSWQYGATDPGARDLMTIFNGAPVTSLDLCLDFDDLEDGTLRSLLQSFPGLTSFKISGRGSWSHVWKVLTPPLTVDGTPTDDGAPTCLHLESFCLGDWLAGCVGTEDDLNEILHMLQARNAYGLHLRKLDILFMHEEEEDYNKLHATFVPQMEELVDVVKYSHEEYVEYELEQDLGI